MFRLWLFLVSGRLKTSKASFCAAKIRFPDFQTACIIKRKRRSVIFY
ncbi:hypothetical protein L4G92_02185 [Neisseria sp. ZJ106]|uniref:Uncharacterized protein n=1 Tax=Neisseria lisongii TaxID=2912188 RepID=A0ABY7RID8_9NEIS|nr:hypothetical protein [Neisseria lisongii]MCF7520862.1 hypothetical protein [Neisseria lisongii]WCL70795.1 hypothetical protein PJU73_05255 [Neisseria lisongii]